MKNIYLGTINRSGGSLFCRLLDNHQDVASYPKEISFPKNYSIAPNMEVITGYPTFIPNYNNLNQEDIFNLVNISKEHTKPIYKWGKETSDPVGVRKNYLEKEFYGKVKTNFDFNEYISQFQKLASNTKCYKDLWNAKHIAYFKAWENNRYAGNMKYVVWHDSGGLYVSNHEKYFTEFDDSYWIYPLRDVYGYIASEKTRLARRYYGSRRFPKVKMPNYLVKKFNCYDLDAHIHSWLAAFTRVLLFQEEYGVNKKFIVYSYKNLLSNTEEVLKEICKSTGLNYEKGLLNPTLAGKPWGGSSHQGKQEGINKDLANYYVDVLTQHEISRINDLCENVECYLNDNKEPLLDLTNISKKGLNQYDYQSKYLHNHDKTAMYSFIMNCRRRRHLIKPPGLISVFAYIYSKVIYLLHIPRLLKLKLFPGVGKQNYT